MVHQDVALADADLEQEVLGLADDRWRAVRRRRARIGAGERVKLKDLVRQREGRQAEASGLVWLEGAREDGKPTHPAAEVERDPA